MNMSCPVYRSGRMVDFVQDRAGNWLGTRLPSCWDRIRKTARSFTLIPHLLLLTLLLTLVLTLAGCGSGDTLAVPSADSETDPVTDTQNPQTPATLESNSSGRFQLSSTISSADLVEGGNTLTLPISVSRAADHQRPISLSAHLTSAAATGRTDPILALSTNQLRAGESQASLQIRLPLSAGPILPYQTGINLVGDDGTETVSMQWQIHVAPTSAPDIYLLIGQSNMEGYSEHGAAQKQAGGADEPNSRIRQLNVTANDFQNFGSVRDFTNPDRNVAYPRFITAEDPLHVSFNPNSGGKSQAYIGPGLSFAKAALSSTTADIILVPAAWAGSGFCDHTNGSHPHLAWNAYDTGRVDQRGSSLFDRALLRTNIAINETGGILRGILWHQGEADSSDLHCASLYQENLRILAASLRTQIIADARGSAARLADADIPFIVGTMSRGSDYRGDYSGLDAVKSIVDNTHRTIDSTLSGAGWVNADDLVPPAYPCGEGSCIHFGSEGYRELGRRYYQQLQAILAR